MDKFFGGGKLGTIVDIDMSKKRIDVRSLVMIFILYLNISHSKN